MKELSWRRLISSVLLFSFLITSLVATPVWAENTTDIQIPVAGSYIVSITKLDKATDKTQYLSRPAASQQPQISEVGILTVTEDQSMTLTYKLYGIEAWQSMQVTGTGAMVPMENKDEMQKTATITVPVTNINEKIVMTGTYSALNNNKTLQYGIRIDDISVSVEQLEQDIFNDNIEELEYNFTYDVYKEEYRYNYITVDSGCNQNIYASLFESNAKIQHANGGYPVKAIYTENNNLAESDKLIEFLTLKQVKTPTSGIGDISQGTLVNAYNLGLYLCGADYSENLITNGEIEITYNSREDLVFGADVRFDTAQTENNLAHYYGRLHPVFHNSMTPIEDITFTDEATGVVVEATTKSVRKDYQLQVDINSNKVFYPDMELQDEGVVDNKTYYDAFHGISDNGKCIVYTTSLIDSNGNFLPAGSMTDNAKIMLPIPAEWDLTEEQKLNVLVYSNSEGATEGIQQNTESAHTGKSMVTIDYENQTVIIDPGEISSVGGTLTWRLLTQGSFILYVEAVSVDPSTLSDGIYQVSVRTSKSTDSGIPSMSNAAFNHTAHLVKKGEQVDVYLRFTSLSVSGVKAYIGGLQSIDAGSGQEFGATYLDYFTQAEDGSGNSDALMNNTIYDADTEFACIEAMKLQLNGGRWREENGGYILAITAPVMAAINNYPAEKVTPLSCTLLISAPQQLTSDTSAAAIAQNVPVYEEQPDVLRRAIDGAKKLYPEENYTADSYKILTKALTTAEAVYSTKATGNAVAAQVEAVNEATLKLVALNNVDKTKLEKALTDAKAIHNEDGTYTEISYKALQASIEAAQAIFDNKLSGQSNVDAQVTALNNAVNALVRVNQLAEGEVEIGATLKKAYDATDSMGNASLNQNAVLKVNADGSAIVTMNFHSMSFTGFTGYLGYLRILNKDTVGRNEFGGWDYNESNFMDILTATELFDYMPDDEYTGEQSTDPDIGSQKYQYPKVYELYIDDFNKMVKDENGNDTDTKWYETIYVQVYAPVMASVPGTSGRQEARLILDFSNYNPNSDVDTSALDAAIKEAQELVNMGKDTAVSDSSWKALELTLEAANDLLKHTVTTTQVTAQTDALNAAIASVRSEMNVQKDILDTKIIAAESINASDYTEASYAALTGIIALAKEVYNDAAATQSQVNTQVEALGAAMEALVEEYVALPPLENGSTYPAEVALNSNTNLTINNNEATLSSNAVRNDTFDVTLYFSNTSIAGDETTPSYLQFFAYENGAGAKVTTGSVLSYYENGAIEKVSLSNIQSGAEQIKVYLGYVSDAATQIISLFKADEESPTAEIEAAIRLDWTKAYEIAYPVLDSGSIERSIAKAESMLKDAEIAGASESQILALQNAIAAANNLLERNEAHKVTVDQMEKTQNVLIAVMNTMPMTTVSLPEIVFDKASAIVGDIVHVAIKTATEGASIFYTENGQEPTIESKAYTSEFELTSEEAITKIIKAIAVKDGMNPSEISTKAITFTNDSSSDDPSGGGGSSGGSSSEKEVNYYVPVELQKEYSYDTSMGNVAFANNPLALAVKNSSGKYDIYVATNPVNVSGYRSAIVSISGNNYSITPLSHDTVETTTKFDGTVHTLNYISLFKVASVPYGTKSVTVSFDVPYTPMDWAVSGGLGARLCFDWSSAELTSDTSLSPNNEAAKGSSTTIGDSVDLTDDTTGVRLVAEEDVLPDGTTLTVDAITSGSNFEMTKKALDGIAEAFQLWNIKVEADGKDVEPDTTVKLYLPIPKEYDASKVAVYRINEDGTKVVIKGTIEDGKYIVETKTFGLYALALTNEVQQAVANANVTYAVDVAKVVAQYPDLNGHWAASSAAFMVERGLMSGTAENKFDPNAQLTRGMLVTILGRLDNVWAEAFAGQSSFNDVKANDWYGPYVQWAATNGIVNGMGDGTFAPNAAITREQLATIINNYAKYRKITMKQNYLPEFTDQNAVSSWAQESVTAMTKAGIIRGRDNGKLDPQGTATRAEVATMLERFIKTYIDAPKAAAEAAATETEKTV